MTSFTPGMIAFFVGLIGYTSVMIASNLFHRMKRKNSFVIEENAGEIIVKRNPLTTAFNSVAHFFLYSLITVITIANANVKTVFTQLAVIYTVCLGVVLLERYFRASFEILLDKDTQTLKTKDEQYSLREAELEISDRSFWRTDDYNAYGLYVKNAEGKRELLYGYSVLWDIKELKTQIETRLNSHQQRLDVMSAD